MQWNDCTEAHELALCLINENSALFPYKERVEIARQRHKKNLKPGQGRRATADNWQMLAESYARHYEKEHGDGGEIFSVEAILLAAAEVADYYERHVAEMEAAQ